MACPPPVILPAQEEHKLTVFWFSGLKTDGKQFSERFKPIRHPNIKYIFPTAPTRSLSVFPGYPVHAWFDIYERTLEGREDVMGINKSTVYATKLVDQEVASGTPPEKIIVGGHSMGAALAVNVVLNYKKKLAGSIALQGFVVRKSALPTLESLNKDIPFFIAHGTSDTFIDIENARKGQELLESKLSNVTRKEYLEGHTTTDEEMQDVAKFIADLVV